jgi:DNA invertase Pin-like site-specific DNA recombinase
MTTATIYAERQSTQYALVRNLYFGLRQVRAGRLAVASTVTDRVRLPDRPVRSSGIWLVACLLAAGLLAAHAPVGHDGPAWAKQVQPPAELTKQYPLGERRLCCRGAESRSGASPAAADARAGVRHSSSLWLFVAGGAAALLAAMSCGWFLGRRRPHAPPPQAEPTGEGAAAPENTAGKEPIAAPAPAASLTPAPLASPAPRCRVLGYACLGSGGDGAAKLEVQSQLIAIEKYCERRGWELLKVVRDVESPTGKSLARPGLGYALDRIAEGQASCLMVSKLERLTRSVVEFAALLEWFREAEARLVVLDQRLDTYSPAGRTTAETIVALGSWEREKLSVRARRGRSSAPWTARPAVGQNPALKERVVTMRNQGMTLQAIADALNRDGVPTLRGGAKWRPSSVQSALGYKRPRRSRASLPPPKRTGTHGGT